MLLRLKAHAKLNLSLKIRGRRPDGFHEIESVMQSVSLADVITLEQLPAGIQLTTNNKQLTTDKSNLAYKAAEVFLKGQGVKIHLEKNIPVAAGLAGGSADAAAVLYGLNQLTINNYQLTINELMELGAEVGSDVPFCLTGGQRLVTGRGEVVSSKKQVVRSKDYYVLVVPDVEVSTKWAYDEYDRIIANSPQLIVGYQNHLEPVIIQKYPIIQRIKEQLMNLGCSSAQMSGSGPSVFGLVKSEAAAKKILSEISGEYGRRYIVHPVDSGVEVC